MKTEPITETEQLVCEAVEENTLRGVKILGHESKNRRRYAAEALRESVDKFEGARVYVNHPAAGPGSPRLYEEQLGRVSNVRYVPSAGLFGDLTFNPKHAVAEQLLWDAAHAPANCGLSINSVCHVKPAVEGGQLVTKIEHVRSVDLVAEPAATASLFESREERSEVGGQRDSSSPTSDLQPLTSIKQLEETYPDLVEQITRQVTIDVVAAVKALMASQLPYNAWDSGLLDAIVVADETTRESLIADRRALIERVAKSAAPLPKPQRPIAPPRQTGSGVTDAKSFVAALKNRGQRREVGGQKGSFPDL